MQADREITFYSETLDNLISVLKNSQRGLTIESTTGANPYQKGFLGWKDTLGDFYISSVQKAYISGNWVRQDNEFGDIDVTTILSSGLSDPLMNGSYIRLAENGEIGLSGFTATSIIGALNEVKSDTINPSQFWSDSSGSDELIPQSAYLSVNVKEGISDDFVNKLPIGEIGNTVLNGFTATSIVGALNELNNSSGSALWENYGSDVLRPITDKPFTTLGVDDTPQHLLIGKIQIELDGVVSGGDVEINGAGTGDEEFNGLYDETTAGQLYTHQSGGHYIKKDGDWNWVLCTDYNDAWNTAIAYLGTNSDSPVGVYSDYNGHDGDVVCTEDGGVTTAGEAITAYGKIYGDDVIKARGGFQVGGQVRFRWDDTNDYLKTELIDPDTGASYVWSANGTPRLAIPVSGSGNATQGYRSLILGGYTVGSEDANSDTNIGNLSLFDSNFIDCNTGSTGDTAKPDMGIGGALQVIDGILIGNTIDGDGSVLIDDGVTFFIDRDYGANTTENRWEFNDRRIEKIMSSPAHNSTNLLLSADEDDIELSLRRSFTVTTTHKTQGVKLTDSLLSFEQEDTINGTILSQKAEMEVVWDDSGTLTDPHFKTKRTLLFTDEDPDYPIYNSVSNAQIYLRQDFSGIYGGGQYTKINKDEIETGWSMGNGSYNKSNLSGSQIELKTHSTNLGSDYSEHNLTEDTHGFIQLSHGGDENSNELSNTVTFKNSGMNDDDYVNLLYTHSNTADPTLDSKTEVRQYRDKLKWLINDVGQMTLYDKVLDLSGEDSNILLPELYKSIRTGIYSQFRFAGDYNSQIVSNAYVDSGGWKYATGGGVEASNLWLATGDLKLQYASGSANAGDALTWTDLLTVDNNDIQYKGVSLQGGSSSGGIKDIFIFSDANPTTNQSVPAYSTTRYETGEIIADTSCSFSEVIVNGTTDSTLSVYVNGSSVATVDINPDYASTKYTLSSTVNVNAGDSIEVKLNNSAQYFYCKIIGK